MTITDILPTGHSLGGDVYVNGEKIGKKVSTTKPYYELQNGNPVIHFPKTVKEKQEIIVRTAVAVPEGTSELNPTNFCEARADGLYLKAEANTWISFNVDLEKKADYEKGSSVKWEIKINSGTNQITKQKAVLTDQLNAALSYKEGSATLTAAKGGLLPAQKLKVDYDEKTNVLKLTMPDGLDLKDAYTITFTTDIKYNINGLANTITFDGSATESSATSEEINLQATGVESGITGDNIRLDITKIDAATERLLPGAVFALYNSDKQELQRATSDEQGIAAFTQGLKYGEAYTFKEIKAPDGYVLDDKVHTLVIGEENKSDGVTVSIDGQQAQIKGKADDQTLTISTAVTNKQNETSFTKVAQDEKGIKALAGATLTLYRLNEDEQKIEPAVATWETDGTPHLVKGLSAGNYRLVESEAPEGYLLAEDITFRLDEKGTIRDLQGGTLDEKGSIQMVDLLAEEDTRVAFRKVEIVGTETKLLPGAELAIFKTDDKGNKTEEVVARWTSGTESKIIEGLLEKEKTYVLSETKAPEGYLLAEDIVFRIDEDGQPKLVKNGNLMDGIIQMVDVKKPETPPTPPVTPPVTPPTPPVTPPVVPPTPPVTPPQDLPDDEYLPEEEEPTPGKELPADEHLEEEEQPAAVEKVADAKSPQTGDQTQIFLWITLLIISLAGAIAVIVTYRKKWKR